MSLWIRGVLALAIALGMSIGGYRKKSLSLDGSVAAAFVGFVVFLANIPFGLVLIVFFVTSSKLTKLGAERKRKLEEGYAEGGQRTAVQVLANGGFGAFVALLWLFWYGAMEVPFGQEVWSTCLAAAFLGHFACCTGDTWSSEVGVLVKSQPRLITTCKRVPTGTNGGVSLAGTAASAAGGLLIGAVYAAASFAMAVGTQQQQQYGAIVFLGFLGGLCGSLLDSVLGATVQLSCWDHTKERVVGYRNANTRHIAGLPLLNNHAVNFVAALITGATMGFVAQVFVQS